MHSLHKHRLIQYSLVVLAYNMTDEILILLRWYMAFNITLFEHIELYADKHYTKNYRKLDSEHAFDISPRLLYL